MSREIRVLKFRQAIYIKNKFHHWHYWGFLPDLTFVGPDSSINGLATALANSQQFTSFHDKNNKEIYGGEGIAITAAKDMFNDDGSISMKKGELYENAIVSFSNGAFWLGYGCIPEKHLLRMILNDGNWRGESIGNIHENPELLKG